MTRNAGVSIETNFTNGLVTEATGLNFPENAVTATDNCVFNSKGIATRRDGFDYEENYDAFAIAATPEAVCVEYVWEAVAGDGNRNILVQQVGTKLYLMNITASTGISDSLVHTIDLNVYATELLLIGNNACAMAHGLGRLTVVHPFCTPFFVEYNREAATFSETAISILTRDFRGVDPRPTGRNTTLTVLEYYNRLNQGWTDPLMNEYEGKLNFFPSDFEVWWLYKGVDPTFGAEVFLPPGVVNQVAASYITRGNSPAPNGTLILTEFYQDRSAVSGLPGIPVITSGIFRPSAVAFHAGRIFYSGVDYNEYSSRIYFSQIVERPVQFGRCYQENDPTSQYSPDLLPTDGGVISIPDIGKILKLWPINNSVLVIASNGVWEITGSTGIGFTATDYTVKKISSVATTSAYSFVNVQGSPFWWGVSGIYAAGMENEATGLKISNVSDPKIKQFFFDIPEDSRAYAKGAYDSTNQVIQWVYKSTAGTNLTEKFEYNKVLNLSTKNSAFYPWTLPPGSAQIRGIFTVKGTAIGVDSASIRYTAYNPASTGWTIAKTYKGRRYDWFVPSAGVGIEYLSTLTSGYKIRGQAITKGQTNYIRLYNEGRGSFYLWSQWDFKTNELQGRWGSPQIIAFNDLKDGDVYTKRPKIRGHGLSLQLTFQSIGRDDFAIVGWSAFDTTNARP